MLTRHQLFHIFKAHIDFFYLTVLIKYLKKNCTIKQCLLNIVLFFVIRTINMKGIQIL